MHFHNYADETLALRGIQVIDADNDKARILAELGVVELIQRIRAIGGDEKDITSRLVSGQGAIVFLCLAFDGKVKVPERSGIGSCSTG